MWKRIFLKSDKPFGILYRRQISSYHNIPSVLFNIRIFSNEFCKNSRRKFCVYLFRKCSQIWNNVRVMAEETSQTWKYNTGHVLCMPYNKDYKNTIRIFNTKSFSKNKSIKANEPQLSFHKHTACSFYILEWGVIQVSITSCSR
jgi:hypothetical protein